MFPESGGHCAGWADSLSLLRYGPFGPSARTPSNGQSCRMNGLQYVAWYGVQNQLQWVVTCTANHWQYRDENIHKNTRNNSNWNVNGKSENGLKLKLENEWIGTDLLLKNCTPTKSQSFTNKKGKCTNNHRSDVNKQKKLSQRRQYNKNQNPFGIR